MTDEEWRVTILEKLNQIHQGLYGVPGTDDKGFCGRVKDLEEDHDALKSKVENQRNRLSTLIGLLIGAGVLGGAAGAGISQLIGG